jgi:hypothetical protein
MYSSLPICVRVLQVLSSTIQECLNQSLTLHGLKITSFSYSLGFWLGRGREKQCQNCSSCASMIYFPICTKNFCFDSFLPFSSSPRPMLDTPSGCIQVRQIPFDRRGVPISIPTHLPYIHAEGMPIQSDLLSRSLTHRKWLDRERF